MIRPYTFLLSAYLLIEGVWGLFSSVVMGGFTTNTLHAVMHIVFAVVGLLAWNYGNMRLYLTVTGLFFLSLGIMYFIPATYGVTEAFNINRAEAYCCLVTGTLSLIVSRTGNRVELSRKVENKYTV